MGLTLLASNETERVNAEISFMKAARLGRAIKIFTAKP